MNRKVMLPYVVAVTHFLCARPRLRLKCDGTRRTHWMQYATHKVLPLTYSLTLGDLLFHCHAHASKSVSHMRMVYICLQKLRKQFVVGRAAIESTKCVFLHVMRFVSSPDERKHAQINGGGGRRRRRGWSDWVGWIRVSSKWRVCMRRICVVCMNDCRTRSRNVSSCWRVSCISICVHRIYDDQMRRRRHSAFVRALCQINEFLYKSHKYISPSILDVWCSCGFVRAMISTSLAARTRWRPREREKVCLYALYI